ALAPRYEAVEVVRLVRELLGRLFPLLHRLGHCYILRLENIFPVVEELHLGIERRPDELPVDGGDLPRVREEVLEGELRVRQRRVLHVLLDGLVPASLQETEPVPGGEAHEAIHRARARHHLHRELLPELVLRKYLPRYLDGGQLRELREVVPAAVDEESDRLATESLPVERALGGDRRWPSGHPEEACAQERNEGGNDGSRRSQHGALPLRRRRHVARSCCPRGHAMSAVGGTQPQACPRVAYSRKQGQWRGSTSSTCTRLCRLTPRVD